MTSLRRLSYVALAIAYLQIVFGAIVRITGSGYGCGDHWPKCAGFWFPPLDRPELIIELTHRYLALSVTVAIIALLVASLRRGNEPAVRGRGGVLRPAAIATMLVVMAAVFGAITVKFALNPFVIVVHLAIAMSLLATLGAAVIRSGGLGAVGVMPGASARTFRGARAGAVIAFAVLVLGALTANVPGANVACLGFPFCREFMAGSAAHLQLTHRVLAYLLALHVIGLTVGVMRRREQFVIRLATWAALGAIVLQVSIAGALVTAHLPPVLRSAHQAAGTLVWLSLFTLALLAQIAARPASPSTALGTSSPRCCAG